MKDDKEIPPSVESDEMWLQAFKLKFGFFISILVGIGVCVFIVGQIKRSSYEGISYDQVVGISLSSKVFYSGIAGRYINEVGFIRGRNKSKVTFYDLFISDQPIKGIECLEKSGKFKCHQFVDIRKGDRIFKRKGEKKLCTERACYVLVPQEKKADLGD